MKRILKLTESDLNRIVKRVLKESQNNIPDPVKMVTCLSEIGMDIPSACVGSFFPPQPPNPEKCLNDILKNIGEKKSELENCMGVKLNIPSDTPIMNERRYKRK